MLLFAITCMESYDLPMFSCYKCVCRPPFDEQCSQYRVNIGGGERIVIFRESFLGNWSEGEKNLLIPATS